MDGVEIQVGDFRQLSQDLVDDSVSLILGDPVYQNIEDYADIAQLAARVLVDGGSCVLQCGHEYLPRVYDAMGQHLDYVWLLVALHYNGNARMWDKRIFVAYKPWVWYSKGRRKNGRWIRDVNKETLDKQHHVWGDGTGFTKHILCKLTEPGDLVCDPCLGSGTTALAAFQTGRRFVGYEIDPDMAEVARWRVSNSQLPLPLPAEQLSMRI